jgi:hypothetical protein
MFVPAAMAFCLMAMQSDATCRSSQVIWIFDLQLLQGALWH